MPHDRRRERGAAPRADREPEAPAADPLQRLASGVGNRGFARLAREGAGVLPDGRAHPDVEAAIAASRGRGETLDPGVRERFGPPLGDALADVRVHAGPEADALARSVSARAFAVGSDLFFAAGEHRPSTPEGDRLLAHELTHVVQQRGTSPSGPLRVSEPGDADERDAERVADELAG